MLFLPFLALQSAPAPRPALPVFQPRLEFHDYVVPLGASATTPQTSGPRVLLLAQESAGGDLNQDGDALDRVLYGVDLRTGAETNYGLATFTFVPPAVEGGAADTALVPVGESSHGAQDLNGDGDHTDYVFHSVDLASGTVRNSGFSGRTGNPHALISGRWAGLAVDESSQEVDLDGDGSVFGEDFFAWDLLGSGAPTGPAFALESLPTAHRTFFLSVVAEGRAEFDWNGDGDRGDQIVLVYQPDTDSLTSTGLLVPTFPPSHIIARGFHSLIVVSESAQGADLDGDGDLLDMVPHVFDLTTGTLTNLQLAFHVPEFVAGHGLSWFATSLVLDDDALAFHVSETEQGGTDLNGDGDAADEDVLFVYNFTTGALCNLGSIWDFHLDGGLLAGQAPDASGHYLTRVYDVERDAIWDTGIESPRPDFPGRPPMAGSFALHAGWVAIAAYEGGTDQTGDGIGTGHHLVFVDARRRRIVSTDVAVDGDNPRFRFNDSAALTVLASETEMARDLDGDGDAAGPSRVLQIVYPGLARVVNTGAPADWLIAGHRQTYPFLISEANDGVDLNGDGDAVDRILRSVRVKQR